jgi:hypothetical protein
VETEPQNEQSSDKHLTDMQSTDALSAGTLSGDVQSTQASQDSKAKLRALLDGVELAPSQTSDDIAPKVNRDSELLRDVPPHHG